MVLAEFGFLTGVYHLDDHVDVQRAASARVQGMLATWQPGGATEPVEEAVRSLSATDARGAHRLQLLTQDWAATLDPAALDRVRAATARLDDGVAAEQDSVDRRASITLAVLLVVVSVGWFFWFRRLVRRHRSLQSRLTAQQVLDAGERRLLALVQNSADLVVVLEPDSTTSFVSPAAEALLGIPADELVGVRFVDLLLPRDVPMLVRLLAGLRDGDQPVILRARHADGRELVLEGTLTNLMADEAVHGWVLTVRDVTDRQSLEQELSYQAFHDSLTGLANRQLFADRLAHALRRRDGATHPVSVLFLDVDDFKHVNDSLGHNTGDRLLVAVAERISGAIREGDTAARLGGDEFAVLMEDADRESAHEVADRLLRALSVPVAVDEHHHPVRASIGIAEAVPGQSTGDEVLRNADVAMYWAKDRGKGTVAVYEAGLHAQALERLNLRSELQRAIREGQLVLHYQPTVDLDTQRISGFEALVRWQHPTRGLLSPAEFIPVAEQSGLIVPLGSWVLREACRAGAAMQKDWQQPSMSVNIAAQQLARDDFVDEVVDALRLTRMPADKLVLEITESVLLDDMEGTVASLVRLREHGVRVAIDDFGTGYSSLSYLAQLPVDVLKVDKSFVDQVAGDTGDTSLVEAIIKMSINMRLTTVAEGVEQPEQAAWLRSARCSLGQGYLWSRPVDLGTARELLTQSGGRAGVVTPIGATPARPGSDGDGALTSVS
ncbi:MAG: EAL domain-containing protein [Nocardioidaceae bacterium]|nr:EAL domain-containing protein [Nocardioidaceae bacterium]